jgi:hypothetical protein
VTLTPTRKLAVTAVLFAFAVALVGVASAVHRAWPLFVTWIPLLTVPYALTRPEPGELPPAQVTATVEPAPDVADQGRKPSLEPTGEDDAGAGPDKGRSHPQAGPERPEQD